MPTTNFGVENAQASTVFADSVRAHLAKKTLAIAKKNTVFLGLADKLTDLTGGMGKVWKGVRYNRVATPLAPLSEGVTPAGTSMTITAVTGTAEQWGRYITLTDVGPLTTTHPVMQKANELLGVNAAETIDRETQRVLQYGTQVYFPGTATSRTGLTAVASHKISHALVAKAVAWLRDKGAPTYDGVNYMGVVDPHVEMDFVADSTFIAAAEYSAITKLENNEIGKWMGVRWMTSNHQQRFTTVAAPTATGATVTGAALTAGKTYYIVLVFRNGTNQNELIYQRKSVTLTTGQTAITLTIPTAPVTGGVFDVYCSQSVDDTGAAYDGAALVASGQAAGAYSITAVGTGAEAPVPPYYATTGTIEQTVHSSYIFGKGAFGVVDLTGIERYITPAGASDTDPLAQRRKTGWKAFYKAIILNNDFFCRLETLAANTAEA